MRIKSKLESEFNNDIHFIPVLARQIHYLVDAFGLDDLLNETLKVCKKSTKGIIFETKKKYFQMKL